MFLFTQGQQLLEDSGKDIYGLLPSPPLSHPQVHPPWPAHSSFSHPHFPWLHTNVSVHTGSGQQSVTGVSAVDDSNSYWRIRGKTSTVCERGTPVKCGQSIRLTHINTGRNLHSHHFTSPLSGNQEVSAFGEDGEGDYLDDWTVLCSGTYWVRDGEVRFRHSSTDVLLSVTGEQYGRPIHGQKEVHGMSYSNQNNNWKVMEGIFMKPSELLKTDSYHAEL
nr:stromal cell-derived factor 2-like [Pelodiscus sinensis]|eukprot:XP_014431508.1 stromal cell-derived factor 2-like [Pelodiscus sinensis]